MFASVQHKSYIRNPVDSLAPKAFIYLFNPAQRNNNKSAFVSAYNKIMEQVNFSICDFIDEVFCSILLFQHYGFVVR